MAGLADAQLRTELIKHGHTPGPITNTTRNVYRRMLADSIAEDAAPSQSKTATPTKKSSSAPGTPLKKTPKREQAAKDLDFSDTEVPDGRVSEVGSKSVSKPTTRTTSSRRRSEIDRLKLDHPGPQMAQTVPTSESGIGTRSRRPVDQVGSGNSRANQKSSNSSHAVTGKAALANNRQWLIMAAVFALMALSVIFALQYGLPRKLPVPKK